MSGVLSAKVRGGDINCEVPRHLRDPASEVQQQGVVFVFLHSLPRFDIPDMYCLSGFSSPLTNFRISCQALPAAFGGLFGNLCLIVLKN